ncbi:MAG: hypothetical protein HRU29_01190 [Rhizobiales bacterium]|nr:hypothetical protein [Hyphomicrobiales bacterium]NRB12987.1 hypothetical protein [Hyphomicrobiales bacterium]
MATQPPKKRGNYTRPLRKREKSPKLPSSQKTAMFLLLVVGGLIGYSANRMVENTFGKTTYNIAELAVQAHEVYGGQEFRPIELEAFDKLTIENWFNDSIKTDFKVPDMQKFNYEFMGARLSAAEGKPAAYLLYINDDDERVAYYMARAKSESDGEVVISQTQKWKIASWHDGKYGYVLLGRLGKLGTTKLQKMSMSLSEK